MNASNGESNLLEWGVLGSSTPNQLPRALVSQAPIQRKNLALEASILLPSQPTNRSLVAPETLARLSDDSCLGLCLVDPFLHMAPLFPRLRRAGVRWLSNFPSVGQHAPGFESYLGDVSLGLDREMEQLHEVKRHGFRTLAVTCRAKDVDAVLRAQPDAIAYVPDVTSFLAGMPTLAERMRHEREITDMLSAKGWTGPFLGYREADEALNAQELALVRP